MTQGKQMEEKKWIANKMAVEKIMEK